MNIIDTNNSADKQVFCLPWLTGGAEQINNQVEQICDLYFTNH